MLVLWVETNNPTDCWPLVFIIININHWPLIIYLTYNHLFWIPLDMTTGDCLYWLHDMSIDLMVDLEMGAVVGGVELWVGWGWCRHCRLGTVSGWNNLAYSLYQLDPMIPPPAGSYFLFLRTGFMSLSNQMTYVCIYIQYSILHFSL